MNNQLVHSTKERIQSIDLLRGLVMVIMALDHVRDYFHADAFLFSPTDLSATSPSIFFTRFITHYCAPVFIFLSGASVFFISLRKSKTELSSFLLKRGIWLVIIECTVVMWAWSFNPLRPLIGLAVIWAIGVSMIVLAGLIHLNRNLIIAISLIMVFGHNLLDGIQSSNPLWLILHQQGWIEIGHYKFRTAYPLIPWIGVMALGYCAGFLYDKSFVPSSRRKVFVMLGFGSIALFIILRWLNLYGDPEMWSTQKNAIFTMLSFLNVTKYPPSLLFLLITLGPAFLFLAYTEKVKGKFADMLIVFGKVPFFYYIAHLYLLHAIAMVAAQLQGFGWKSMVLSMNVNKSPELVGYGFSLGVTYLFWIAIVMCLYPFCYRYNKYKSAHPEKWWLSYL